MRLVLASSSVSFCTQAMALEAHIINQEAFQAVQTGRNAMQQIHRTMNVEAVDETIDQMSEQMDMAKEISDALGQPIGPLQDDDELEGELADLLAEPAEADSSGVHTEKTAAQHNTGNAELDALLNGSSVPQDQPQGDAEDEDALNKLMAEMAAN